MQKTGLFFGSFNPVHVGHLIIANYMADYTSLDEVWLVVSPQNPFKKKQSLANNYDRLHLVQIAVEDHPKLRASNIEFGLPQPSYTIDTLAYLKEKYPDREFVLIMGGDNLVSLHKWKNADILTRDYDIYVYLRPGLQPGPNADLDRVHLFSEVPLMNISASFIRKKIKEGRSVRYMLTKPVFEHIEASNMYR